MTPIKAIDERIIPFPQIDVWRTLSDVSNYVAWWPRSVGLRVLNAEPSIINSTFELRPYGGRPFRCRIESIDPLNRIQMRYFGGFIEGCGMWRLEPLGSNTRVLYELDVLAAGRVVAWIGRCISLSRIHSHQMQHVLRNLQHEVQKNSIKSEA